jgi:HSP20 family protein
MPGPAPPPILPRRTSRTRSPQPTEGPVEFYEEDGVYTLRIEMPGYETDEISVTWHDGTVCVSTTLTEDSGEGRTYHRAFWMPKEVEPDAIEARYQSGVLSVTLPIEEEDAPYGEEIEVNE